VTRKSNLQLKLLKIITGQYNNTKSWCRSFPRINYVIFLHNFLIKTIGQE
jgi:hypothetical protein